MSTRSAEHPGTVRAAGRREDEQETDGSERRSRRRADAATWAAMLVGAVLSLTASLVLSVDALRLAEDPGAALSCNINAVLSCGTVAGSWQASLLGFPNAFLGLMTEPVVITLAVAGLSGVRFPRWIMVAAQAVYTIGLGFAYWLFHQALFDIGALCPWCSLVTLATTLVWFEMTRINIREDNLGLPRPVQAALSSAVRYGVDTVVLVVWVLLLVLAVVLRYGDALFA
jgi:uncharacterized membrane protein